MPTTPKPDAKTKRLVLIPKPGQEIKITAFKEICARNGLEISKILFEKVEQFLKEHNWPPGNSQTVLEVYPKQPPAPKCHMCKADAVVKMIYIKTGKSYPICQKHKRDCLETGKWRVSGVIK